MLTDSEMIGEKRERTGRMYRRYEKRLTWISTGYREATTERERDGTELQTRIDTTEDKSR